MIDVSDGLASGELGGQGTTFQADANLAIGLRNVGVS